MYTLLFIDDDKEMLEILASSFKDKGFTIHIANSAKSAYSLLKKVKPDCITLDVMMPDTDGFAAFDKIKSLSSAPIIFITGRVSEEDKVRGLMMGADDYIEKPFGFNELHARIITVLRRTSTPVSNVLSVPPLEIDLVSKKVTCDGSEFNLSPREFEILYFFVSSKNDVLTYEDLGTNIWGSYRPEDRASIMVSVSRLRKKLESNPVAARMIETVWSVGYKFIRK